MATLRLRVVERTDDGGVVKLSCVDEGDATIYASTAVGSAPPTGPGTSGVTGIGDTLLIVLQLPLLSESDDYPGIYIAATSLQSSWPGCVVSRSTDDGVTFDDIGYLRTPATVGYTTSLLGRWDAGNVLDASGVLVKMVSGTLSSITWDALINGGNRCCIGDEVLHFKTATLVSAGPPKVYKLTGFLRGRLGTEDKMAHLVGDRFVLLDSAVSRFESPLTLRGRDVIYRGVSFGKLATQGSDAEVTETQEALLPLDPVYLRVGKVGTSYRATWTRRTRYSDTWASGRDASLGESEERYLFRVWHSGTEDLVNAETTDQTYTFGSGLDLTYYTVQVQQISARVGLGPAGSLVI